MWRSGRRLPPVHPGEILRDEFLTPMEISVYRLAQAIKVSRPRLNDIVRGRRGITTDTALRLGRYFGMTPEFWINLQTRYDLDVSRAHDRRRQIERDSRAACCSGRDGPRLMSDIHARPIPPAAWPPTRCCRATAQSSLARLRWAQG